MARLIRAVDELMMDIKALIEKEGFVYKMNSTDQCNL